MRRLVQLGLLLLALALSAASCSQDPTSPETNSPDKRSFPGSQFLQSLTQEHLETVWDLAMEDQDDYDAIIDTISLFDGATVIGKGGTYPDQAKYYCTLTIPANSVVGGLNDLPDEVEVRIELPKYRTPPSSDPPSFDVFIRALQGEPVATEEIWFEDLVNLEICEFPWYQLPPEGGTEYFYRIQYTTDWGIPWYHVRDLQEVQRSQLTGKANYAINSLLLEGTDRPDRSGTAVNETDPDDVD